VSQLAPAARRQSEVLQRVLAGEHAVVYGYGVAGARLSGADRVRAERGWTAHRGRRDRLEAELTGLGVAPIPPAASYALPARVATAEQARTLVTLLEERLAAVWADAVADLADPADRDLRRQAAGGLADAAVAASRWRGGSVPFPGLPERQLRG
jgi:antitoxin (DNA-binding transcriptional repressor) of toxin-antitoxin stability system